MPSRKDRRRAPTTSASKSRWNRSFAACAAFSSSGSQSSRLVSTAAARPGGPVARTGLGAVVAEFGDGADVARHDRQARCHRLDDCQRGRLTVGGVDVSPVSGQEFAHRIGAAEVPAPPGHRSRLHSQVLSARSLAEQIEGEDRPACLASASTSSMKRWFFANSSLPVLDQIPERLWPGPRTQRRHEIADHGGRHRLSFWEPVQERIPSPAGHVHNAIDLRIISRSNWRIARKTLSSRLISLLSA